MGTIPVGPEVGYAHSHTSEALAEGGKDPVPPPPRDGLPTTRVDLFPSHPSCSLQPACFLLELHPCRTSQPGKEEKTPRKYTQGLELTGWKMSWAAREGRDQRGV